MSIIRARVRTRRLPPFLSLARSVSGPSAAQVIRPARSTIRDLVAGTSGASGQADAVHVVVVVVVPHEDPQRPQHQNEHAVFGGGRASAGEGEVGVGSEQAPGPLHRVIAIHVVAVSPLDTGARQLLVVGMDGLFDGTEERWKLESRSQCDQWVLPVPRGLYGALLSQVAAMGEFWTGEPRCIRPDGAKPKHWQRLGAHRSTSSGFPPARPHSTRPHSAWPHLARPHSVGRRARTGPAVRDRALAACRRPPWRCLRRRRIRPLVGLRCRMSEPEHERGVQVTPVAMWPGGAGVHPCPACPSPWALADPWIDERQGPAALIDQDPRSALTGAAC